MSRSTARRTVDFGWRAIFSLLAIGVAIYSYRYLAPRAPVFVNAVANPFLYLHVAGAATALLIGPFQFIAGFRSSRVRLHRLTGRLYVAACMLGGAAGLPLALGSTAGPIAAGGFGTLSIVWLITTWLGWRRAVQRRFAEHREWMLRSWALTFAAVTLRLYLPLIPTMWDNFVDGYRFISWACWLGNLAVMEAYLRVSQARGGTAYAGTAASSVV